MAKWPFDKEMSMAQPSGQKPGAVLQDNERMTLKVTEKFQGCHSHFRPRELGSQRDDYLCLFQRTGQLQRVTDVTSRTTKHFGALSLVWFSGHRSYCGQHPSNHGDGVATLVGPEGRGPSQRGLFSSFNH